MRKLILLIALSLTLSLTTYGQTKVPTKLPPVPASTDVLVAPEDVAPLTQAYQIVESKKKDYDLAVKDAIIIETEAAANVGVSRKTHELTRNEEGKLVFRLRQQPPTTK